MSRLLGVLLLGLLIAGVQAITCSPLSSTAGGDTVLTFNITGTCDWTVPSGITAIQYLIVAGGGGGGGASGGYLAGGGGAGGSLNGTAFSIIAETTYDITVGSGGTGQSSAAGSNGGNSTFKNITTSITAIGGGGGGYSDVGAAGGSGGGGSYGTYAGGAGTSGQGYHGGAAILATCRASGGGGGTSAPGQNGHSDPAISGNGGDGVQSGITGTAVYYAGGGGGGGYVNCADNYGLGGSGGGGAGGDGGSEIPGNGISGTNDLGGGGGGAGNDYGIGGTGGNGGSGVVILRYASAASPGAAFTYSPGSVGTVPFDIFYTDTSTNIPTSWTWDVDNGSVRMTSILKNPVFNISIAGNYSVNFSATNGAGTGFLNGSQILAKNPVPVARIDLTAKNITNTTAPLTIQGTDTGTNVSWYLTVMSIGSHTYNASNDQNPSVRFPCNAEESPVDDVCTFDIGRLANDSVGSLWNVTSIWYNQSGWFKVMVNSSPTATFTANPLSGVVNSPIQFTATVAGPITVDVFLWDFGDTQTSTLQNPVHSYTTAGQYTVILTVTNYTLGQTVITKINYVTVQNPKPTAAFTGSPLIGNTTTQIHFADGSTGTLVDGWSWDFGDTGTSNAQNPDHTYSTATGDPSLYTISLIAKDSAGTAWENDSAPLTKSNYFIVFGNASPTYTPTADIHVGTVPFSVNFEALRGGGIWGDSYHWDFGDGTTSQSAFSTANKQYVTAGQYDVVLTVVNFTLGETQEIRTKYILAKNPVTANANATPAITNLSTPVYFVDSTTGNITNWVYDYREGNLSYDRNPTHQFPQTGVYHVIHNVTDSGGTPWEVISGDQIIDVTVVNNTVGGDFVGVPTVGTVPFWVHLIWTGTGGLEENHTWLLGDGNTSAGTNVWYLYEVIGSFTVNATVCNDAGCVVVSKPGYITVNPHGGGATAPVADFVGAPLTGQSPLLVHFTDTSDAYGATLWAWDFDNDGINDVFTQNADHTYTLPGIYSVKHTVSNVSGTDDEVKINYVLVENTTPVVDFTCIPTSGNHPLLVFCTGSVTGTGVNWTHWTFGDLNESFNDLTPTNWYSWAGSFDVSLTACNVDGYCGAKTRNAYIVTTTYVPPFTADFTANITVADSPPLPVQFTTTPVNTSIIDDYLWDFGDGGLDIVRDPVYTYTAEGLFTVCLRIRNMSGAEESWMNKSGYITIVRPAIPIREMPLAPIGEPITTVPDTAIAANFLISAGLVFYSTARRKSQSYAHIIIVGVSMVLSSLGGLVMLSGAVGTPQTIAVTKYVEISQDVGSAVIQVQRQSYIQSAPTTSTFHDPSFGAIFFLLATISAVLFVYYIVDEWQLRKKRDAMALEESSDE